jgi:hypothetical protein
MLGTLAGISIAFISMRPAFQIWEVPWIGFASLAIVLIAWTAGLRLPGDIPGGLAAVIVGSVLGWAAALAGWSNYMDAAAVTQSVLRFGFYSPAPSLDADNGSRRLSPTPNERGQTRCDCRFDQQRRIGELPPTSVLDGWHSRDEIQSIARGCLPRGGGNARSRSARSSGANWMLSASRFS